MSLRETTSPARWARYSSSARRSVSASRFFQNTARGTPTRRPRSEAGADTCFVKFAAVRDGRSAEHDYLRLLDACEALAVAVGMSNLWAGANMARHEAYRHLVARGFRTEILGVTMHRQNDPGYCRPGAYVIDDWR